MAFVMTRCPKKKLIWSSNRFDDLSASDFGTPNRAARKLQKELSHN